MHRSSVQADSTGGGGVFGQGPALSREAAMLKPRSDVVEIRGRAAPRPRGRDERWCRPHLTVDLCSNTSSEEIAQILLVEVVLMEQESTTRPQIAVRAVVYLEGRPEPNAKVFGTADLKRACCLRPHATRTGPPCGTIPAGGQLLAAGRGRRIARGCSRLLNPPRGAAVGTQGVGRHQGLTPRRCRCRPTRS